MSKSRRIVYALIFIFIGINRFISAFFSIELEIKYFSEIIKNLENNLWNYIVWLHPIYEDIIFGIISAISAIWILQLKASARVLIICYSIIMILLWFFRQYPGLSFFYENNDFLNFVIYFVILVFWINIFFIFNSKIIKEQFIE